jgi:hypothetical protein
VPTHHRPSPRDAACQCWSLIPGAHGWPWSLAHQVQVTMTMPALSRHLPQDWKRERLNSQGKYFLAGHPCELRLPQGPSCASTWMGSGSILVLRWPLRSAVQVQPWLTQKQDWPLFSKIEHACLW